jgi:hypothetical protein
MATARRALCLLPSWPRGTGGTALADLTAKNTRPNCQMATSPTHGLAVSLPTPERCGPQSRPAHSCSVCKPGHARERATESFAIVGFCVSGQAVLRNRSNGSDRPASRQSVQRSTLHNGAVCLESSFDNRDRDALAYQLTHFRPALGAVLRMILMERAMDRAPSIAVLRTSSMSFPCSLKKA